MQWGLGVKAKAPREKPGVDPEGGAYGRVTVEWAWGRGLDGRWAGSGESLQGSVQPRRAPGYHRYKGCRPGHGQSCGRRRAPRPGS